MATKCCGGPQAMVRGGKQQEWLQTMRTRTSCRLQPRAMAMSSRAAVRRSGVAATAAQLNRYAPRLPPRRDTLLCAVATLAASLVTGARSISQRWNVDALTSLSAILKCVLDNVANLYFHELYVVLFHVKLLVSIFSVGYAWALLWNPDLPTFFQDLNAELAVVLDLALSPTQPSPVPQAPPPPRFYLGP
ncbi:hypothetical protein E2562_029426 [Oryza meyeriana var. granulata]|uniref:Uncharacterized protein n=1 Tax=Oryza meyeriana var. granulata TaxID=110450 RepID=A0A6G1DPU9_9ORYZ|nr:hypothetical protein E2562_029426 [Oryza meyeriana var. granulata]